VGAHRRPGNPLSRLADDCITVDSPHTATVQEVHLIAIHLLCAAVDRRSPDFHDRGALDRLIA
jgi:hypothetical protein